MRRRSRTSYGAAVAAALLAVVLAAAAFAAERSTELLTPPPAAGGEGNAQAACPALLPECRDGVSADGSVVFFHTTEQLVAEDGDALRDVYANDGGTLRLVSAGSGGADQNADYADASEDGSRAVFVTRQALVADDTDTEDDVYERAAGVTQLVSTSPTAVDGGQSRFGAASDDGSVIAFVTNEQMAAGDTDTSDDVYLRSGGATTLVSPAPVAGAPSGVFVHAISTDGSRVTVGTWERLAAADTDTSYDVYRWQGGALELMSTGSTGGNGAFGATGHGASADGAVVFFSTDEQLVAGDSDAFTDVYSSTGPGAATLVSTGTLAGGAENNSYWRGASADGSHVFFVTEQRYDEGDDDSAEDTYARAGGVTTFVTTGPTDGPAGGGAWVVASSPDGGRVLFETRNSLVAADTDAGMDVYERSGGTTTLRSGEGTHDAFFRGASRDAATLAFETEAPLVAGDTDGGATDVYEHRADGLRLVSTGPLDADESTSGQFAGIADDGSAIAFTSSAVLVTGDDEGGWDDLYAARLPEPEPDSEPEGEQSEQQPPAGPPVAGPAPPPLPGPVPPAPELPVPEPGETAVAAAVSGEVLFIPPGRRRPATKVTGAQLVPIGSRIDARFGRVRLTFAKPGGGVQTGEFHDGRFTIHQRPGRALVELRLVGLLDGCRGGARAAAKRKKRRVWGDADGTFRTTGNHGAATVRGTRWLVEDRCDGTLVRVERGVVDARDFARGRTVRLRAGQRHFARAAGCRSRRRFKLTLGKLAPRVVHAQARLRGRPLPVSGPDHVADVDLRGRPEGRYVVRIVLTLASGKQVRRTRTFHTCTLTLRR